MSRIRANCVDNAKAARLQPRLMTIRIALGAALVLAASVPARAAARFLVGASAADITPPLAATAG